MAIPAVTVQDVDNNYDGDLQSEFELIYLQTKLRAAVDYAMSRWRGAIDSRLAAGTITDDLYRSTIAEAVLRILRNTRGLASENEANYGYSTRDQVAAGYLYFSADEIETLAGIQVNPTTVPGTIGVGLDRGWR